MSLEENHIEVEVGEPELLNPNTYENIALILRNIGKNAGIKRYGGETRSWQFTECDGGIYPVVMQLINNVLICEECQQSFYGKELFLEHRCSIMHDTVPQNEFDWIFLFPGLLHLEMNAGRAFMELNWEVFMKHIVSELGFESQHH